MAAKRSNSSFSYTLLVTVTSFCLIQMSVGRPVEISDVKFNVPYFTSFGRQSCQSCGPQRSTLFFHCNQTQPGFPIRMHCKIHFIPRVDVFALYFTTLVKLDGTFLASDRDYGSYLISEMLPLFANEKYRKEREFVFNTGYTSLPPKGHYELKSVAVNQDDVVIVCISCQLNITE